MNQQEVTQAHQDWKEVELSDLSSDHLKSERLNWYNKWAARLIDHARGVENKIWNQGL